MKNFYSWFILAFFLYGASGLPKGSSYHERIIGGEEANPGQFPYQVQLLFSGVHMCGGALLTRTYTLTAAHCTTMQPIDFEVVVGQLTLSQPDENEQRVRVTQIIRHPEWNSFTLENDIALLRHDPVNIDEEFVRPILIPRPRHGVPEGTSVKVAGWGSIAEGIPGDSDKLLFTTMNVYSDDECRRRYEGTNNPILDSMLCAGVDEGGKDSCNGDSGGPLICEDLEREYVCGIVSWAIGCARPDYPGVNTEVSYYSEWIQDTISSPKPWECVGLGPVALTAEYTPKGEIVQVDGMDIYEVGDSTSTQMIFAVYDIYGFDPSPNIFQIADNMAAAGFRVVLPDFFRGVPWKKEHFPAPVDDAEWFDFVQATSWDATVRDDLTMLLAHYKAEGFSSFGIFGFCWGGKISFHASHEMSEIIAAGQIHPSAVLASDADLANSRMVLLPGANDADMEDYCDRIKERRGIDTCIHRKFTDVNHGFAGGRADWTNDTVRGRAEEAITILRDNFCYYMNAE